jgi:hypothetical protein
MEVGVLAADSRGIAASEVIRASQKHRARIETLVSLVVSAAKMPIPDVVVRRPVMYPHIMVPRRDSVSRKRRRGQSGGENGDHAQRFH